MTAPLTLETLRGAAVVAVLRANDPEAALSAVEALVAGGITGIEVTYTTPGATAVIAEVARRHGDAVVLGAGTVTRAQQAREAVDAGATFLVSPGVASEVAQAMKATGAMVMLGALTPSEVMAANALGSDVVKIFPASLGGPDYLKALRGPFPDVALMPTGGVDPANLGQWLRTGAVAVGAGGTLVPGAAMAAGRFEEVEAAARSFVAALAEHRAAVAGQA